MDQLVDKSLERDLLAQMFLYPETRTYVVEHQVGEELFWSSSHRAIFSALKEEVETEGIVAINLLWPKLESTGKAGDIPEGKQYLTEILSIDVPRTGYGKRVDALRDLQERRDLVLFTNDLASQAQKKTTSLIDLRAAASEQIEKLTSTGRVEPFAKFGDVAEELLLEAEARQKEGVQHIGLATQFKNLDFFTGGFQPGNLVILAARPSQGKSAFSLDLMRGIADRNADTGIALFSMEMSRKQVVNRLLGQETNISGQKIKLGKLTPDEWSIVTQKAAELARKDLVIDDHGDLTPGGIYARVGGMMKSMPIKMVVVDYLQLMYVPGIENENREVSIISRSLKQLAVKHDCVVLALSQLSRAPEARSGGRPKLSDLRSSGSIEQDADIVMFIHHPHLYGETGVQGESLEGIAHIHIDKNRDGPTGQIDLEWHKEYASFREITGKTISI